MAETETTPAPQSGEGGPAAPVGGAQAAAPKPAPAPSAPATPPEPESTPAFAVLTAPRGALIDGQIVTGSVGAIAALVTAGAARPATPAEVAAAHPFHFPIPLALA